MSDISLAELAKLYDGCDCFYYLTDEQYENVLVHSSSFVECEKWLQQDNDGLIKTEHDIGGWTNYQFRRLNRKNRKGYIWFTISKVTIKDGTVKDSLGGWMNW